MMLTDLFDMERQIEQNLVSARKRRAREWLESYAERTRYRVSGSASAECRALEVIVLTHMTSDWLAEHDPMALKQCQDALEHRLL